MVEEKRAEPRRRVLKGARIVVAGQSTFDCTVRNLSSNGALIRLPSIVGIPDHFDLVLDDGQRFTCVVIRRTASDLGVSFS
jgi:hypothetical protein